MNMQAAPLTIYYLDKFSTGLIIHIIMGHPNYIYGLSAAANGGAIGSKLLGHIRRLKFSVDIALL
jgi:hypothetical protein